jgi:hypothetical protein
VPLCIIAAEVGRAFSSEGFQIRVVGYSSGFWDEDSFVMKLLYGFGRYFDVCSARGFV